MKQKIIAVANHKGGVGKTTSTVNIGAALAERGYNVLLVDLDAQANLTISLQTGYGNGAENTDETARSIYHALKERKNLPVVKVKENLSVVPSSLDMAGIELDLAGAMSRECILKRLLKAEAAEYDVILLDCPPALALITVNAFVAATNVIVPLTAEGLPYKGLDMLQRFIGLIQQDLNPAITIGAVFMTRWEKSRLSSMVTEAVRSQYSNELLDTKIRKNITLAEASVMKSDIFSFDNKSNGSADYKALVDELVIKLGI